MNGPSTRFDGCGLLADNNNFSDDDTNGFGYIIPSKVFNNFDQFINKLQIPYYDTKDINTNNNIYTIVVVEDGDNCFNNNNWIKSNFFVILLLIFFILL